PQPTQPRPPHPRVPGASYAYTMRSAPVVRQAEWRHPSPHIWCRRLDRSGSFGRGAFRKRLTELSSNARALARRAAPCQTVDGERERLLAGTIVEFDRVGLRYGTGA